MDFSLNIYTINKMIDEYINQKDILGYRKDDRNYAITNLSELGWSGEAKDSFLKAHDEEMKLYEELEEDINTMINILMDEKEQVLKLKQRSDGFINCITRSGDVLPATDESGGLVGLEYGGQAPINHIINYIDDDYLGIKRGFSEIGEILNEFEYGSFSMDLETANTTVTEETKSLTDFDESFNVYCTGVKNLESYICSQFTKISGVSEATFKSSSIISSRGDIDKNELRDVMLKNEEDLTSEEQEKLKYIEKVLGEEEYNKLKDIMVKDPKDLTNKEKAMLKIIDNIYNAENVLEGNVDDLKEYDPLNAKINDNKITRVKKKGANGEYFAGTIDEFGNFIPDDLEAFNDDGYTQYRIKIKDELEKEYGKNLEDWKVDAYIYQNGPEIYKTKSFGTFLDNRWPIARYFSQTYKITAASKGLDSEQTEIYGDLYGTFTSGMMLESILTTGYAGLKSLISGSYRYDGLVGSGIGNVYRGEGKATFTSKTTKNFWKSYEKLPDSLKKEADEAFELFKKDPDNNSLNFEKLSGTSKKYSIYSVRINGKYRAYGQMFSDGTIEWFDINGHDYKDIVRNFR